MTEAAVSPPQKARKQARLVSCSPSDKAATVTNAAATNRAAKPRHPMRGVAYRLLDRKIEKSRVHTGGGFRRRV